MRNYPHIYQELWIVEDIREYLKEDKIIERL